MSTNTYIVFSSPYGPIALTLDKLNIAKELAKTIIPENSVLDIQPHKSFRIEKPRLVDAEEAGRLFGVKPTWLLQRAREGRIPHVRIGKYVRFDPDEIRVEFNQKPGRLAN